MCFDNYSSLTFLVGLLAKINHSVPASQVRFNNSMSLNVFASKAATSAVTVGHSSND